MKRTYTQLLYLAFLVVLLLAGGCRNRVYGPLAVPSRYAAVPVYESDEEDITAQLLELHKPTQIDYRIGPLDHFNFSVYEHEELSQLNVVVTPDGYLSLPLIGPVKVGGMTLVEATDVLTEKIGKYIKKPKVSLIPVQVGGYNFTIVGRVNMPGTYPISIGQTTLVDGVALARGFSQGQFNGDTVELADLDNAYIIRDGKRLPVNFAKAFGGGDQLNNIPLRNGDYINIPSVMSSTVAFLGEVRQETYVGYKEGMTIMQALPFTRGLKETHSANIKVIRGGVNSPEVYTVNVDMMLNGTVADFPLRANDIVYVPRDGLSDWNVMISKILPSIQVLSMLAGPFGNPSGFMNLSND